MIWGINFNGTKIPHNIKALFNDHIKVDHERARLQGVADSVEGASAMMIQANNGHRRLKVVARGDYFGIYVY